MQRLDFDADGHERVVVGAPVLFAVHDDQIRRQFRDGSDVGILGAADVRQIGSLAVPGARHRVDSPRCQRLGSARNEADHPHERRLTKV